MANDTTRMEAENTTWALVVAELERLSNLGSDSERWDGVISLHDLLKAHPPDETETITSLQRELAEAREHAKEVRLALTSIRAAVDADLGLERASNEAPVEVNTELYRTKILEAIAALKSRASLTPLTDPSVRGVLVEVPRDGSVVYVDTIWNGVPCRFRPASEFGVAGGERIKELEAELADWKADTTDQLCVNCSDPLEYQGRADAAAVADAERLRKAIETAAGHLDRLPPSDCTYHISQAHNILLSALTPSPAAENVVGAGGAGLRDSLPNVDKTTSAPAAVGERIKELEAERRLSPSVEEALSAIERALSFFRQDDRSGCDGMNEREISLASTAGVKVVRNAFGTEQSMHSAWRKRATEAESDAERLRKAIETHQRTLNPTGDGAVNEVHKKLWSALSPSPAAASGDWLNKMADAEDAAGDISIGTSAPAAESDKPYGLVEQMDAGEGTVYGRRVTVKRREEPAAETQGNARHHIEGAKIPEGGSGSPSADQRDALSARLAACEERCREFEAGLPVAFSAWAKTGGKMLPDCEAKGDVIDGK